MKGLFLYGVATKSEMVSHEFTKIPFSELVATTPRYNLITSDYRFFTENYLPRIHELK